MRSTIHKHVILALTLIASVSLGGCGSSGFGGIRGPSAVLQSTDVVLASANTRAIVTALAEDSDISISSLHEDPKLYYGVAFAGFNFIDDQCATYFDKLFFVQRDRQFGQQVLAAGSAAAGTILALTGASTITFGAVASAFGFSSTVVDSVAGSFLFQLPPATTYGFVKELQRAYRQGVNPADVTSAPAAYHAMQDYLAICLPPNIEARLVDRVANVRVTPQAPTGFGTTPSLQVADRLTPQAAGPARSGPAPRTGGRLQPQDRVAKPDRGPAPPTLSPKISQFFKDYDPSLDTPAYVHAVLKKLCVPGAEDSNPSAEWADRVKTLIKIYEDTPDLGLTPTKDGLIDRREGDFILSPDNGPSECLPDQKNFFEKVTFPNGIATPRLLDALNKLKKNDLVDHENVKLSQIRDQIKEVRKLDDVAPHLKFKGAFISNQITQDLCVQIECSPQQGH
jgi:hypothetical protein